MPFMNCSLSMTMKTTDYIQSSFRCTYFMQKFLLSYHFHLRNGVLWFLQQFLAKLEWSPYFLLKLFMPLWHFHQLEICKLKVIKQKIHKTVTVTAVLGKVPKIRNSFDVQFLFINILVSTRTLANAGQYEILIWVAYWCRHGPQVEWQTFCSLGTLWQRCGPRSST